MQTKIFVDLMRQAEKYSPHGYSQSYRYSLRKYYNMQLNRSFGSPEMDRKMQELDYTGYIDGIHGLKPKRKALTKKKRKKRRFCREPV